MSNLSVQERNGILVVDSRLVADRLGIAHKNLLATIDKYFDLIEPAFGKIALETRKSERGKPERFAWLTEDQATFLMTLSRNTDEVVQCKLELVEAFSKAKQTLKKVIPAQSQEIERLKLELQLIQAKQRYQDSAQGIIASTSLAMLAYLRGDGPTPVQIQYRDRFIDATTGKEVGTSSGRCPLGHARSASLTQLIADAGLNPKSTGDRNRVKRILKCYGLDHDLGQGWSTASSLREYLVLEEEPYNQALLAVLGEVLAEDSEPNLFIHQMQQTALAHQTGSRPELVGE